MRSVHRVPGGVAGAVFFLGVGMGGYICICYRIHTLSMKNNPPASSQWKSQLQTLWPALKGSLARVYKPCIRKNCPACLRGDKHPAWILSYTDRGRRRCLYVPVTLVPRLRQGLKNGRQLEKLLYRMGPALVEEHRRAAKEAAVPKNKN